MPQHLRTATPSGDWRSFKFISPFTTPVEDGDLVLVGNTVCSVLEGDAKYDENGCREYGINFGEECVGIYHADKIDVNKGADVFAVGDAVYWSGVAESDVVSTWATGYYWIGICVEAAGTNDDEVMIDLKGDKATIGAAN